MLPDDPISPPTAAPADAPPAALPSTTYDVPSTTPGEPAGAVRGAAHRPHPSANGAAPVAAPPAASWTALTHQPTFNASTMILLTDGRVMVREDGTSQHWWALTPDAMGSYVNGTWHQLADSLHTRDYFASAVLADGRVLVAGGERSDVGDDSDRTEIYDPVANTWTAIGTPGWGNLGDASACLLADGRLLIGNIFDTRTAIYDPVANTWTATGNKDARCDEETWTLLPDGSVLTVECDGHPRAERYIPSNGTWISAGSTPVDLVQASSIEIGPAVLRPDGTVFCVGATGHTAVYTPSGNDSGLGAWTTGPDFPEDAQHRLLKAKDAPASLLPSGHVLCVAGPAGDGADDWPNPTEFFEFDGTNLNRAPDPPNANTVIYEGRMLLLPTGQVLYAAGTQAIYAYNPEGAADPRWRPALTNPPSAVLPGATYRLAGTQLNGLSQASSYGDDAQMATNYPLVRLRDPSTGHVTYCRTHGHSSMGVATGSLVVTTNFDVPAALLPGDYELTVVANGISSAAVTVSVGHGLHWRYVGNTRGFGNLLDNRHPFWVGDFAGLGYDQVLFHYNGDANWWLGTITAGALNWQLVGNTRGFGNLLDGQHPIWIGDFTGSGRAQVLFHYGGDANWWLGTISGGALSWQLVGNTRGFGNLLDGRHPIWIGDFGRVGHAQVLFHYGGDANWWLGTITAGALSWQMVGNTRGFGNLLDGQHPIWIGDFSGSGGAQVLFHYRGDANWWLGTVNGGALIWQLVGNTRGFGNLLDGQHPIWIADFGGVRHAQVLFYYGGDANWWLGTVAAGALGWQFVGNTHGFGNLLDGHHPIWIGDFGHVHHAEVLFHYSGDANWWLANYA